MKGNGHRNCQCHFTPQNHLAVHNVCKARTSLRLTDQARHSGSFKCECWC